MSAACPPPTDLAWLGCYQQLSHPCELGPGTHEQPCPSPTWTRRQAGPLPGPRRQQAQRTRARAACSPAFHAVALAPQAVLAPDQGTMGSGRSAAAPRPGSGLREARWTAGPPGRAGALGNLVGPGPCHPRWEQPAHLRGQPDRKRRPGGPQPPRDAEGAWSGLPQLPLGADAWPREAQSFLPTREPAQPWPELPSGLGAAPWVPWAS